MPENIDPALIVDIDVRDLLSRGLDPRATITAAADGLEPGRVLHVRSPFEPIPLHHLMEQRGFAHRSAGFASDDWSTWYWPANEPPPERAIPALPSRPPAPAGVMDLRHLAAPEPLLWIISWTARAAPDASLLVMLPFFPTPLGDLLGGAWVVESILDREDGVVVRIAPSGP